MDKIPLNFIKKSNNTLAIQGGNRLKGILKKNTPNEPLISIVTVVYNGEKFIESAIQSIIEQTYKNIEYIIVDGNSTDSTLDIIKKYDNKIDYWLSENDTGIYDAMNKGISLCNGDFIGILNSDDFYNLETCEKIKDSIIKYPTIDIFHGNIEHVTFNGSKLYLSKPKHESKLKTGMVMRHPSCFISKKWYQFQGGYDTNLKIASDFKFLYQSYKNGASFKYLDFCITFMREGGISDLQAKRGWKEVENICADFGDPILQIKYYSIIRQLKYFVNKKILNR